ncbi:MAG: AMP-binding protein [Acidobacteria bacterium]|nr:AMP-binding protein [Acidobacteriota bacterium]
MTLAQMLERAALRRPVSDAVIDGTRRLTYSQLKQQAMACGGGLVQLGVRKRDRVVIAVKNRLEHVIAYWALQRIGGVATPVNFRFSAGEMRYVLEDSGASVVIFESGTKEAVLEATRGRSIPLVFVGDDAPGGVLKFSELLTEGAGPDVEVREEDLSLILYTSGTTGRPKGVPRTHKNHHMGALAHVIQCHYEWEERTLGVMPLYHTMGIHSLTSMPVVNGCFVCQPEWNAEIALRLITEERISALYLIPTLFYDLVQALKETPVDVSAVRKLAYAGAPMLAHLTQACVEAFRPTVFVNHYGSTEVYTFSIRPNVHVKPGCAGYPGVHSALRIVVPSTERPIRPDEVVPQGGKGEIIVRLDSDEAFAGYWNRPDADAKALRDGWYFTGDMGYLDADGELYVSGRVDDMIISGGENIHPVEVEEVLARHPQVLDVAVVGEPDEKWGEKVVAFVVRADPMVDSEALDRHCRESADLANFKRPRRFVFVTEIPKTPSGKILRRVLRERLRTEIQQAT